MKDARMVFLARGARGECPRCRSRDVFKSHYRLHDECPSCGLPLEQEDGWSLGAIPLNYALTCILWILPLGILFLLGLLSLKATLVLAGASALVIPFLTYRHSKSLWVGIYYAVLPHELESAQKKRAPDETGAP